MVSFGSRDFLRRVLFTDALTCGVCGLFMVAAAGPFGQFTRIPPELLFYAGVALFPIAAFMVFVGARAARSGAAVAGVIVGNLGWVAASLWLMLSGAIAPTGLGQLFLGAQASVVLLLTVCEMLGALGRGRAAAA